MGGNIDVHDGDDRFEDDEWEDDPAVEPPRNPTGQVRIIGAEPAGEATQVVPVVPSTVVPMEAPDPAAEPAVRIIDEPVGTDDPGSAVHPVRPGETAVPGGAEPESDWFSAGRADDPAPPPTELPHWTEAPTGQVPAVLARDPAEGDPVPGIAGPAWREEHSDWVAHEEEFAPAMFGDEEVPLGSLDETDSDVEDRRPWEFDLPSSGAPAVPTGVRPPPVDAAPDAPHFDVTDEVPVVSAGTRRGGGSEGGAAPASPNPGASRAATDDQSATAPAWAAAGAGGDEPITTVVDAVAADDEVPGLEPSRPTGSPRTGRVRRTGLRGAGRMKAKRPEEMDALTDSPLAAEPPGASVTAVPGAGRRRGGVAGLAAADRAGEVADGPAGEATGVLDAPATPNATPTPAGRLPAGRRPVTDEPDGLLGGGPPARRPPREREERSGDIRVRIGTGVVVAIVGLTAFALGNVTSLVLSIVVLTFAAGEFFGVLRRAGYHPATLLGLVGSVSLMIAAYDKGPAAVPLVLVLITAFTLLWYLLGIERGSAVAGTAATLFTIGWISLFGSYAALLLSPAAYPDRQGIAFLLGAIIATVANDVGALVVGGWIGRHPLAPTISPNKTWEGWAGGAVLSIVVSAAVVGAIHPWTPSKAALLGLVVAVVAPLGDLCESLLKRDLRLKDMGTLLPGHGGVLDRVDALLFVLPATYYLVRALHLG